GQQRPGQSSPTQDLSMALGSALYNMWAGNPVFQPWVYTWWHNIVAQVNAPPPAAKPNAPAPIPAAGPGLAAPELLIRKPVMQPMVGTWGRFMWGVTWELSNTNHAGGWIIQEVTRTRK